MRTKRRDVRPQRFAIRVPFGDRGGSWAIGNGPTTRFLTPTPAMAPQSACHPRTLGAAPCRNLSCFAAPSLQSTSQQPALGDPQCRRARGSDAPCGRKSGPNTLSVSAPAAASLPLAGQAHHDRAVSGAQRRQTTRERDTEGTASSFGDVPSHTPHAVPGSLQSRQRNRAAAALSLGRPSGRLTRGERRPLRSKTSTKAWSTSVPCGDVAPPSQQFALGERTCATA